MSEKEKELQNLVDELRKSGEEMGNEITHLKRVIAGQKGRLTQIVKQCFKWHDYGREADKLIEKRIAEIDDLKVVLCSKDKTIAGLESQVNTLKETIAERNETIKNLRDVETEYLTLLEMPWYKRIFFKG